MASLQSRFVPECPDVSLEEVTRSHLDLLALSFCPGLGGTLINRLVRACGAPNLVLNAEIGQLLEVEGISRKAATTILDRTRQQAARKRAAEELAAVMNGGYTLLSAADTRFPAGLAHVADAPALLYCRGNIDILSSPTVAIVGSRAATTYGKRISYELARELARHGISVASGMAMGIDGEAHAGALAGGGATVGVLGCGIDVTYPPQHADLFEEVGMKGMLLSEYPLGTAPEGFRFPERNRIISGMSLGTVVIEASLKSGSLITAGLALEQGREVFAVPGRIDSPRSRGTHRLIQEGAKLVTCVDDILEELDLAGRLENASSRSLPGEMRADLTKEERQLLSSLEVYPVTIDELVNESGQDAAAVFQLLLALELKGLVRQLPGQLYERVG